METDPFLDKSNKCSYSIHVIKIYLVFLNFYLCIEKRVLVCTSLSVVKRGSGSSYCMDNQSSTVIALTMLLV